MKKHLLFCFFAIFLMESVANSQVNLKNDDQNQAIESLRAELARLEAQLSQAEKKLPFEEMALLTIVSGERNMNKVTNEDGTFFVHEVRIDNPVCNNNPRAIVFATSHTIGRDIISINVYYNSKDGYWYIKIPDWMYKGFIPGIIVDPHPTLVEGVLGSNKPDFRQLSQTSFEHTYGIGYAGSRSAAVGMKFSVLIFKEKAALMTKKEPSDTSMMKASEIQPDTSQLMVKNLPEPVKKMDSQNFPVTGEWQYKMLSASGAIYTGKVFMVEEGATITGNLFVNDNTRTTITGTLINNELTLSRETGLQTTQAYRLIRVSAKLFTGTYSNKGKYADSGSIEFSRQ